MRPGPAIAVQTAGDNSSGTIGVPSNACTYIVLNAAQYVIVQSSAALEVCAALQRAPSAQQQSIVQLLLTDTATAATAYVRFFL